MENLRDNLEKLAFFMWDMPEQDAVDRFSMFDFNTRHSHPLDALADEHICETVSCAIGWGPSAGIMPTEQDKWWHDYSDNHFARCMTPHWCWMFSSHWKEFDNTPKGVAKRIFWYLEKGVPECFSHHLKAEVKAFYEDGYGYVMDVGREQGMALYKDWTPTAILNRSNTNG